MKNPQIHQKPAARVLAVLFCLAVAPIALFAQQGALSAKPLTLDQFVGNYKGTANRPTGDISITLEIKSENGKAAGRLTAPQHPELQITSGEIVGNRLTLKLSSAANAAASP